MLFSRTIRKRLVWAAVASVMLPWTAGEWVKRWQQADLPLDPMRGEMMVDVIVAGSIMTSASTGLALTGLAIDDTASAKAALGQLDTAIGSKDTARAKFGYKMNRLEGTVGVLAIQSENLMAAESRVSDVDVATEMAEITRNQVLAQAGISMLAQANTMPQMALSLLR